MKDKDESQRKKALDINKSFIVQAPAGSGKTELLAQRYLKILSSCKNPENVFVITFTNKAVEELTDRIINALKSTKKQRPKQEHKKNTYDLAARVIERSKEKNWDLLKNPSRLKIITIDSLFNVINNRYSEEFQLNPNKEILQGFETEMAYKQAAKKTLLMINDPEYGDAIAELFLYLDNNVETFYKLIIKMLSMRDQWLYRLYKDDTLNRDFLQNSANKIIINHLYNLNQAAKKYLNNDFFKLMFYSDQIEIDKMPGYEISDLDRWLKISSICLTKTGAWRKTLSKREGFSKSEQKEKLIGFFEVMKNHNELKDLLFELNNLPDPNISNYETNILTTIAKVLKICAAQLILYFEKENVQDFIQASIIANQALDDNSKISEVALFLDYKLEHLLIDEFQDTSFSQFNCIGKIVKNWQEKDNKTLFLVGDPMQSIYRFRESKVALFLQAKQQGIAGIKLNSLTLTQNFRSFKSVVDNNNEFFSKMFPAKNDMYKEAISYSKSYAASEDVDDNAVTFYPFLDKDYDKEAEKILEIIKNTIKQDPSKEIAVLVRSRSHLTKIIKKLEKDKIDFEALNINPLKNDLLIRDLFSLTKALMHLGDKLAWLSLLRSPWCGLLLKDLLVLASNDEKIIYEQLIDNDTLSKLSKDGQQRCKYIYHCLANAVENNARFSFSELLIDAIDNLSPDNSFSSLEKIIKNKFLNIIFDCEQKQSLNIETIKGKLEEIYSPSKQAKVKLMTIHQAKGLEFDTVIIPGLGRSARNNDKQPIIHIKELHSEKSDDKLLLLAPIKSIYDNNHSKNYSYLKFIEKQQQGFEDLRILYVAMTRAKSKLHLLGTLKKDNKAKEEMYIARKGSFLALLEILPFFQDVINNANFFEDNLNLVKEEPPKIKRPIKLEAPDTYDKKQHNKIYGNYQNIDLIFKSLIGDLVHKYYENESFLATEKSIIARLIELGIPPLKINDKAKFILNLLKNTKNSEKFKWLFKKRNSTLIEAEFAAEDSTIIIDRMFIDDDILWIIDFKTAAPRQNESLANFIKKQKESHSSQLLLYKKILSNIYDNNIKCRLYCPAIDELIEITD